MPTADQIVPVLTDASGNLSLGSLWPFGVPSGFTRLFRCWIPDPGIIDRRGFAASNGLQAQAP